MQADTWEGEFNGPASPSTVRENIEVRFLFYGVAGGFESQAERQGEKKNPFGEKRRNDDYTSLCVVKCNFLIRPNPLIWPVDLETMKTLPSIHRCWVS